MGDLRFRARVDDVGSGIVSAPDAAIDGQPRSGGRWLAHRRKPWEKRAANQQDPGRCGRKMPYTFPARIIRGPRLRRRVGARVFRLPAGRLYSSPA